MNPRIALFALSLTACTVGPNHVKPDVSDITPAQWKWKAAAPRDEKPKGEWWTVFKDSELNRLESLAVASNNDLRAALARVEQGSAALHASAAAYSPAVTLESNVKRERTSSNLPTPVPIRIPSAQLNSFNVPLQLSYEVDLWGRVRRLVESAKADAEGSAAAYQNVLLSLTGEIAASYFQLCAFDSELGALRRTFDLRDKSTGIIEQKFKAGVVPEVDAARARSELATTKAEIADVKRQREEMVSVIALLCGQPASTFSIAERSLPGSAPRIPSGIPADLLERRPDIAAAERKVASNSAQIGVEKAGYFPAIRLTGDAGYLSKETSSLFTADSRVWSFGPSLSLPLTGYLLTKAKVNRAKAMHEESIAAYRQTVLTGVKDVETSLTQIHYRAEQAAAEQEAVTAAQRATELVRSRYDSGAVSFLELLDAERTSLMLERQFAQVRAQQFVATVRLIKALGGKW